MIYIVGNKGTTIEINGDAQPIVTGETHNMGNEVCSQTLEDGRAYIDHIVCNPDKLTLVLHVGNVSSQSQGGLANSLNLVYRQLRKITDGRELLTIYTQVEKYQDMAVDSVSMPINAPYKKAGDITLELTRVTLVGKFTRDYMKPEVPPVIIRWPEEDNVAIIPIYTDIPDSEPIITDEDTPELAPETKIAERSLLEEFRSLAKQQALEAWAAVKDNPLGFATALGQSIVNGFPTGQLLGFLPAGCKTLIAQAQAGWAKVSLAYNAVKGCFSIAFQSASGGTVYSGALFPGCNSLKGLNLKDENGDDFPVKGVYMLAMSDNADKNPNAFVKDEATGTAPCYLSFYFDDDGASKYGALLLGGGDGELNYDFDSLDYRAEAV